MTRRLIVSTLLLVLLSVGSGYAVGRRTAQPHMQAALDHLRQARTSLDRATADKGGHRAKAIELTNAAIHEVEEGIEYDRTH